LLARDLNRHALHATCQDRARGLRITLADAEAVVREPAATDVDEAGKPRYYGAVGNVNVCIVLALDEPDLIVTIYDRRRS
jgi:hypothetical protein